MIEEKLARLQKKFRDAFDALASKTQEEAFAGLFTVLAEFEALQKNGAAFGVVFTPDECDSFEFRTGAMVIVEMVRVECERQMAAGAPNA